MSCAVENAYLEPIRLAEGPDGGGWAEEGERAWDNENLPRSVRRSQAVSGAPMIVRRASRSNTTIQLTLDTARDVAPLHPDKSRFNFEYPDTEISK